MAMPQPTWGYPTGQAPLRGPRPKEVEISFWLWIGTFVLGLVGGALQYPRFDQIRTETINRALAQNPTLDRSSFESIFTGALVVGAVIGLTFFVAEVVFVFLMRGGRNWARIVMAVLGGLSVLFGLIGLAGGTAGTSVVTGLLQLLLLIGAIVTMFLPPANAWFSPRQPGF
ncbi:MAG TPA: hypothetical protein VIY28_13020 [Pseudonocardiaceae bacterium]